MNQNRIPNRFEPYVERASNLGRHIRETDPREVRNLFHAVALYLIRFIHIFTVETRDHQLWQRAAALTYTTILSLFPLLIVLTSLGSVFYNQQEEEQVINFIENRLLPPTDVDILNFAEREAYEERSDQIESFVESIRNMSESYRETAPGVGVFGLMAFMLAAFFLYNSIEGAFEASWETGRKRTLARTISGFTILIVFAPLLFGVSITASSFMVKIMGIDEKEAIVAEDVAAEKARKDAQKSNQNDVLATFEDAIEGLEGEIEEKQSLIEEGSENPDGLTTDTVRSDIQRLRARLYVVQSEYQDQKAMIEQEETATTSTVSMNGNGNGSIIQAVRDLDFLKVLLGLVTPLFNSIMLALAFMFIPQRRVRWQYALMGGLFAGILWEVAKVGFFYYVYLSTMRRQLLQSLGAVPIFLIWIYFTWLVFLLGNEVVFVTQNFRKLINIYYKRRQGTTFDGQIFVAASLLVADAFSKGERGMKKSELAQRLQLTFREFEDVLKSLCKAGVVDITNKNRVILAKSPSTIRARDLLELGCDPRELCDHFELSKRPEVERGLKELTYSIRSASGTDSLQDLLNRKQTEKEPEKATAEVS